MKAYSNDLSGKNRIPINEFKGINTGISPLLINDGQAEDMQNLDTRDYPLLKTREPRELITDLSGTIHHLGNILGETLTVIEGSVWKYYNFTTNTWTNIKTSMSGTGNGRSIEFVDYTIYVNGTTNYYKTHGEATTGTFSTMPDVTALAIANSKLYGIEGVKLHHSGIRLPNVWADGENSGYIVVETPNGEELSAITEYGGHIMCFKPHSTHKVFGMYYGDHNLQIISDSTGCVSQRSICKVKTSLMWLGDGAIYTYDTSSAPTDISLPVKKYIDNADNVSAACSGTDGDRYYLSLPQKESDHVILVYDTRTGIWSVEDDTDIIEFTTVNNELYGVTAGGKIYKMISSSAYSLQAEQPTDWATKYTSYYTKNSTTYSPVTGATAPNWAANTYYTKETIEWYWCSKWFSSGSPSMKQNWFSIYVTLETGAESTFKCEVINNNGQSSDVLNRVYESVGNGYTKVQRIMIPPAMGHNSDWFQSKLSGTGSCTIHNIERDLRIRKGSY